MKHSSMQDESFVSASLDKWRHRVTNTLFIVFAIGYLPGIVLHFIGHRPRLTWQIEACMVATYVTILAGAFLRAMDYRVRMWTLLSMGWLFSIVGGIAQPYGPFIRSLPFGLAVIALVLIGARAGRIATVISAVITLAVPFLLCTVPGALVVGPIHAQFSRNTILVQSVVLIGKLVCMMVLLQSFHSFLLRSLFSERLAVSKLEQEAAERAVAYEKLQREVEERQRLEREIARVSDDERRRLGQDVHDGVCQQITGALLRCQALERRIEKGRDLVSEDLAALSSLLEEAIDEAYAVAKGLWPLGTDSDALSPALRTLAKRTQDTADIICQYKVIGDVNITDPTIAQHLYRIAQEAVSNASRHAKASRIVIELHDSPDELLLRVEDNGIGIPIEVSSGGLGLHTMAYRAQMLEGTISIKPGSDGGTCVICRVPRVTRTIHNQPQGGLG